MIKAGVLVAIVLVATMAALVTLQPQPNGFRAWIAEVRDGDDDWGWNLLSAVAHRAYAGDRGAYATDMAAADWDALHLRAPVDVYSDDGFVAVQAELLSAPTSVPAFLFERRIVHGVCHGNEPMAIGVYEDRRVFRGNKFDAGGGGGTGSEARCNAAFTAPTAAMSQFEQRPGLSD